MSKLSNCLIPGIALIATAFAAASLDRGGDAGRWINLSDTVFQNYSSENGLPDSIPTSLAEDGDGFLWIGSQNGLARWDGYHFRNYRPDPGIPGALTDNFIKTLHTDARGRLWVGTNSAGLALYDRNRDQFITYPAGPKRLSGVNVLAISDDGAGGLWVGTAGGLDRINPDTGSVQHFRHDPKNPGSPTAGRVRAICRDRRNTLWVGTQSGLVRMDGRTSRFDLVPLQTSDGTVPSVLSLFEDSEDRIWIGTAHDGAYVITSPGASPRRLLETDPQGSTLLTDRIETIAEPHSGEVWLGTYGQGIVSIQTATFQTHRIRHDPTLRTSLADDTVWKLHRDRAGLIWVCTNHGVGKYNANQVAVKTIFGSSSRKNGVSDLDIYSIMQAPNGSIWLGLGNNGVDILDPTSGRIAQIRPDSRHPETALPKGYVTAFAASPEGDVYIGTYRGLYRADRLGRRVVRVSIRGRDPSAGVYVLLFDDGVLWVGGSDGLWALARGKPRKIDRLTDPRVRVIERGLAQSLWIGTENGLNRLDLASGMVEHILPRRADGSALATSFVSSVLTDRQGRVWVGTLGGGINILEKRDAAGVNRFRRLGTAQGLPNDNVNKLLQAPNGSVLASTDGGIAIVDSATLTVRALGRAKGVSISNYWTNSGVVTREGELLLGGVGGLTIIQPDRLADWIYRPPVVVSDVRTGGKPLPASRFNGPAPGEPLTILPEGNSLAVEFSALDYSDPEHHRYSYRLDGFDKDWIETEPVRRLASYTNLPPGAYNLRLRGSNRDDAWTGTDLTVPVLVLPAWYQTIWFRLSGLVAACALLGVLIQGRTAYLRRRQRELMQQVADRTGQLEESQRQLEKIAYFDVLTGLPNRRMFTETLRQLLDRHAGRGGRFTLLLIDLDNFKQINDTLGHDAGDALLLEVGNRLRAAVRESDCVARTGGDEFAIILAEGHGSLDLVCRRIVDSFIATVPFHGADMKTSSSIGAAVFPLDGETQDRLYKCADLALYEAKRAGRNRWRGYHRDMACLLEMSVQS